MSTDDDSLPLAGTVLVAEGNQYGNTVYQPVNALAKALCTIAGTKTLTPNLITHVKSMGFTVHVTGTAARSL